jgi:hypothetical protein
LARAWPAAVRVGSGIAVLLAAHAVVNSRLLRTPRVAPVIPERVSVLLPARDEADHVGLTVSDLLASAEVPDMELIVLDDGSTDATAEVLARISDPRLRVVRGPNTPPPAGWLGKPWACHRLAEQASGEILVFADADVRFGPHAVAAAVAQLRDGHFDMVAPWPRQIAGTWFERLVQPLQAWSWLSTMPLRWSESSLRPSLAAANGQFLVCVAAGYHAAGGHAGVRDQVLEDIALMRAFRVAGRHTATLDGTQLASTRMYQGAREVIDGYAKSLWSAFGGPVGTTAVVGVLVVGQVVPAVAVLLGPGRDVRVVGLTGYVAATIGRAVTSRRMSDRVWPDAAAHPLSIAAFAVLNAVSWSRHLRGTNRWKGRPVIAGGSPESRGKQVCSVADVRYQP